MKFVLKVGDKDLVMPDFSLKIQQNDKSCFIILLENFKEVDYWEISHAIENDIYEIQMENAVLGLTIKDKLYCFDLEPYLDHILNEEDSHFSVGFAYKNKNNEVIPKSITTLTLTTE